MDRIARTRRGRPFGVIRLSDCREGRRERSADGRPDRSGYRARRPRRESGGDSVVDEALARRGGGAGGLAEPGTGARLTISALNAVVIAVRLLGTRLDEEETDEHVA